MSQNLPNIVKGFWLVTFLVGLAAAAVYLLVKQRISPTLFAVWICVLVIFDLWRVDAKFIRDFDYQAHFRRDSVIEFLQKDEEKFRVMSLPGTHQSQNILAFYDLMQVFGYHGNQLKAYDDFTERKYRESARTQEEYGQRYAQFLFGNKPDLLNVKYVLSPQPIDHPKFRQVFQGDGIYVFQNQTYLPRARVVFDYQVIEDRDKILDRIDDPDFDYRNAIILKEEAGVSPGLADTSSASGTARMVKDEINSQLVIANLSRPGFLILSENYYPSWKAYVDGRETKIYRANYLFRAVHLDQGEHEVRFVLESGPYRVGKTSTLLTSVLLLALLGLHLAGRLRSGKS